MRVVVVTPPKPVITPEDAAEHLRLGDGVDEHDYLESIIAAATAHIDGPDGWLGRAIGVQTLEARMCGFGCGSITLPYRPIIAVESVQYLDSMGQLQTVDPATYELFGHELGNAWGQSWPVPGVSATHAETVRVRYRAGYETLPVAIRAAILLMVGDLFEFRETALTGSVSSVSMSTTVENLLAPFRVWA